MDEDQLITIAFMSGFLTVYASARLGSEAVDSLFDTIEDVRTGEFLGIPKSPILTMLGYGRKGGIL